jgi:hypothetical protein
MSGQATPGGHRRACHGRGAEDSALRNAQERVDRFRCQLAVPGRRPGFGSRRDDGRPWRVRPVFSSGSHGNQAKMKPAWKSLYAANADVIFSGHDHDYERFAPQKPDGTRNTERGIREFVVGTGGRNTIRSGRSSLTARCAP